MKHTPAYGNSAILEISLYFGSFANSHLMILENISAFSMGAWPCSWWSCDPAPPVAMPVPLVELEEEEGEEGDAPGLI